MQIAGMQSQGAHPLRRCATFALVLGLFAALVATICPAEAWADPATNTPGPGQFVDTTAECTINLTKCPVNGQRFTAYRVATMQRDGSLVAVDAMADAVQASGVSPEQMVDVTDASQLRTIARTWQGYVVANANAFESKSAAASGAASGGAASDSTTAGSDSATANAGGSATISGLLPGMYLVVADNYTASGKTYFSDPYLIALPAVNKDGTYIYTREVEATKVSSTQDQKFKNVVQKLWKDGSATRPASVHVRIYDGTKLYAQVDLNQQNNWKYEWEGQGNWSVREDAVSGYTCAISSSVTSASDVQTTLFQITNTAPGNDTPKQKGKQTKSTGGGRVSKMGDTDWTPLVIGLLVAGVACVIVGVTVGRRKKER